MKDTIIEFIKNTLSTKIDEAQKSREDLLLTMLEEKRITREEYLSISSSKEATVINLTITNDTHTHHEGINFNGIGDLVVNGNKSESKHLTSYDSPNYKRLHEYGN